MRRRAAIRRCALVSSSRRSLRFSCHQNRTRREVVRQGQEKNTATYNYCIIARRKDNWFPLHDLDLSVADRPLICMICVTYSAHVAG